jgi:hypothetical protein
MSLAQAPGMSVLFSASSSRRNMSVTRSKFVADVGEEGRQPREVQRACHSRSTLHMLRCNRGERCLTRNCSRAARHPDACIYFSGRG